MRRIAVIGSGTAGLHLTYALQQSGHFDVTVYTDRTPDEVRGGRVMSTQVHFAPARSREARYGMPSWQEGPELSVVHVTVGGQKLFAGPLQGLARSVDQRLYFSRYMEALGQRGVKFQYGRVDGPRLGELVDAYDLVVDCSGKRGPLAPFLVHSELSELDAPQRKCSAGYFSGVAAQEPAGVGIHVLPGAGELFEIPALTEHGPVMILFIEAVPGGALDQFTGIKTAEAFTARMTAVLEQFFPQVTARLQTEGLRLCDEQGFVQIAVKPVVHLPYTRVNGRLVLGCGDSVICNDPITGQGANTASRCAEELFLTLLERRDQPWTEETGEAYWSRIQTHVREVTRWTNGMMGPLPEAVVGMLIQGAQDPCIAERVAGWFHDPGTAHEDFFGK